MNVSESKKYRLGLVFSGGGTKAAAHCGALQALREYGIEPEVMAGTSAGSLVASFYSAGFKPVEMIDLFNGMNFFRDIVTPARPRGGLFDSRPLVRYIREVLPYKNFEDLPIPVYAVASDLDHGRTEVFSKGELAPRLVASCSIPVVFQPMVIDGIHYIDGGVFMNLPVLPIREQCEKVIAISVRSVGAEKYRDTVMHVASRAYEMMFMSNIIDSSRLADLFIELDTEDFSVYDMSNVETLFRVGYDQCVRALDKAGYTRVMPAEKISFRERDKILSPIMSFLREHRIKLKNITGK